jgi:hypothetical protein
MTHYWWFGLVYQHLTGIILLPYFMHGIIGVESRLVICEVVLDTILPPFEGLVIRTLMHYHHYED